MPLHVMANFGGFLCECMAWKGHIVRGDRCLKDYGFRLSQARVDSAERFYSNCTNKSITRECSEFLITLNNIIYGHNWFEKQKTCFSKMRPAPQIVKC
eukprot:Em0002g266a